MKKLLIILSLFACFCFKVQTDQLSNYRVTVNDTTFTTWTTIHDTPEVAHLPQKIFLAGYDTVTVSDTSYVVYYKSKHHATVNGTVTSIVPNYDTIAAHDTSFVCHNCAVHDTTTYVINVDTSETLYGVFIVNSPQTSLSARITQAQSISAKCTFFRYNSNSGDAYSVPTIKTSGLKVAWTFNYRPVQNVAYFPTGSALTTFTDSLNTSLNIATPDVVSIENEEGNAAYHKGTVYDYLNELYASAVVAHAHKVPISNGGTTNGVVYAMRQWYNDLGFNSSNPDPTKDSVTWLNTHLGLSGANNSYALQQRDWYVTLLAGIKSSTVDYVNFHWYEPFRTTDLTPIVTTGVLPALINYLQVATGKPVITTEAGTRNTSTSLLIDMFTEIAHAGTRIAIYYDGVGPWAIQNEAGYKTYLNSLAYQRSHDDMLDRRFAAIVFNYKKSGS